LPKSIFYIALALLTTLLLLLGVFLGSTGWSWPENDAGTAQILWQIRLPRTLGSWLTGALLGLSGAIAQGLFRNPLADPYLLGSSSGAALAVALWWLGWGVALESGSDAWLQAVSVLGLNSVAFIGAVLGVWLTLNLARGVGHTLRLLLAGVVVGMVLSAGVALITWRSPQLLRPLQGFMLGSTSLLGWDAVLVLALVLIVSGLVAQTCARALDALSLGEPVARSLGVNVPRMQWVLIIALALATGAAVAQSGVIAFVGLVAPHLVRSHCHARHGLLLFLSAATGGALLLAADVVSRSLLAPEELPVGVVTALLGGLYLLWQMRRENTRTYAKHAQHR
jgi:iron complex transport system permease protein